MVVACALLLLGLLPSSQAAKTYPDKIGLELSGIGDGGRDRPFADLARTLRPWTTLDGQPAPVDKLGWPTTDAQTVLFDIRPFGAWAPPIDDPDAFQPDWSGVYPFEFTGQADLRQTDATKVVLRNLAYDPRTNRTTGEMVVPKGQGLVVLALTRTKRTPTSPLGSGITGLRMMRPGYRLSDQVTFTREFLDMVRPFRVLRYMDWLDTNHNPGYYGDAGHHALHWADRKTPAHATQATDSTGYGAAWEYVVELSNATGKDAWINIPIAATDDYVRELAKFLKARLKPTVKVYLEHSNEVWNFGFPQYIYNKLAAIAEVRQGGSPLSGDGETSEERWSHRRHAKRLHDIQAMFVKEFGAGSFGKRVFPVYASWVINPDSHYRDVFAWFEKAVGPVNKSFWSLSGAAYYNAHRAPKDASPTQILAMMRRSSDANRAFLRRLKAIGDERGLALTQYEIGPDNGGGDPTNVANRIRANRLPAIKEVVLHDARQWFAMGGDLYMYFASPTAVSRHGCWGLSEDVADLNTPKWRAIYELTGFRR